MNLSAMQIYAIMLLQELRKHADPVGKKALSEVMGVTVHWVQQIARPLLETGLIASRMGKGGGYLLTNPKRQITVLDVLHAIPVKQHKFTEAGRRFHDLSERIDARIDEGLARMRVDDL